VQWLRVELIRCGMEDGNVSECVGRQGTDCENGDSDADW